MELRQLEYFCRIADTGSIHEAARCLNLTQPPLSYQLRQLEEELGVRLFERGSRGVALTEAGKLLYARAESLLDYARSTRQEVSEAGRRRVLRLGITSSTAGLLVPEIARFLRRFPEVSFQLRDGASYTLLQYVLEGIIDLSVARTPLNLENVDALSLGREPMLAVSAPSAPLPGEGTIRLEDLLGRPLILYRRYEELVMAAFRRRDLAPDILCVCDDARTALPWVEAGLAAAVFPRSMRGQCAGLSVQLLSEPELETETVLIWKKGGRLSPTALDFITLCRERA